MAKVHPDDPIVVEPLPNSSKQQVHLHERLRLVNTNLDVGLGHPKADNVEGEVSVSTVRRSCSIQTIPSTR